MKTYRKRYDPTLLGRSYHNKKWKYKGDPKQKKDKPKRKTRRDRKETNISQQLSLLGFGSVKSLMNSDLWRSYIHALIKSPGFNTDKCGMCKEFITGEIKIRIKSYRSILNPKNQEAVCEDCYYDKVQHIYTPLKTVSCEVYKIGREQMHVITPNQRAKLACPLLAGAKVGDTVVCHYRVTKITKKPKIKRVTWPDEKPQADKFPDIKGMTKSIKGNRVEYVNQEALDKINNS